MGKGKKITKLLKTLRKKKEKLILAIEDENYEQAALLRDEMFIIRFRMVRKTIGIEKMLSE